MGRDKALLPLDGATLIEHVASKVHVAAGNVSIIAPPDRYRDLPYPVIADMVEGCGPLGGVFTALSVTEAPWNLIVGCDMPALTVAFLEDLFRAVYHRRCLEKAASAIDRKILKMHDFVSTLRIRRWPVLNAAPLENINTPDQWSDRGSAR
jgi:molybdopterin-guanine dinucleotide biosynthesis protein A